MSVGRVSLAVIVAFSAMHVVSTEAEIPAHAEDLEPRDRVLVILLRLGAFLCLAGWTWVHLYWEAPYGVLLWQDTTYELASDMGVSWEEFVGTGANDGLIQKWMGRIGWLYLACAILTLTVRQRSWFQMAGLALGTVMLTLLSYAKYVSSQYQLPMFVEHGGQMLMPSILVLALLFGVRHRITISVIALGIITTFAGHGCYAVGLWPTPPNFTAMTIVILGVEYETAKTFLNTVGMLDFLICFGLFVPYLRTGVAIYATVWGLLTSIARPVAGMSWSLHYYGADHYLHEAILRTPHWILPLYLAVWWIGSYRHADSTRRASSIYNTLESVSKTPLAHLNQTSF